MPELSASETLQGQRVQLPGHFEGVVTIESVRALGQSWEVRVRLANGALDETVLAAGEFEALLQHSVAQPVTRSL